MFKKKSGVKAKTQVQAGAGMQVGYRDTTNNYTTTTIDPEAFEEELEACGNELAVKYGITSWTYNYTYSYGF